MEIGDEAYGSFGRYGAVEVRAGKVVKVSASGQVTVDFGEIWPGNGSKRLRRFTAHGYAIGEDGRLIDRPTFDRLSKRQKEQRAKDAVIAHLNMWSFKEKADMTAFAQRLAELVDQVPDDWKA